MRCKTGMNEGMIKLGKKGGGGETYFYSLLSAFIPVVQDSKKSTDVIPIDFFVYRSVCVHDSLVCAIKLKQKWN